MVVDLLYHEEIHNIDNELVFRQCFEILHVDHSEKKIKP